MLIFLYGPDTYRSREKLKEIIERYQKIHKSGLSLKLLDLKEKNFQDFDQQLRSISMFKEKKLIILENAFSNNEIKTNLLKNKKNYLNTQDTIVFYEETIPKETDSLLKFLKEKGKVQEFKELSGQRLKNWIQKEFEKYGATIEKGIPDKLIDFVGSDLWRLSNEIKKLVSYSMRKKEEGVFKSYPAGYDLRNDDKRKRTGIKDVELLVRPKIETDIFKTIDAIAEKKKNKALSLIHRHLEKGDAPLYLLSMINFQFRNLLIVKELMEKNNSYSGVLKKSGLHPFVVKKSCFQAKRFKFEELKKIYQKIFQADLDIKTGRINPEIALDLFIAEI